MVPCALDVTQLGEARTALGTLTHLELRLHAVAPHVVLAVVLAGFAQEARPPQRLRKRPEVLPSNRATLSHGWNACMAKLELTSTSLGNSESYAPRHTSLFPASLRVLWHTLAREGRPARDRAPPVKGRQCRQDRQGCKAATFARRRSPPPLNFIITLVRSSGHRLPAGKRRGVDSGAER